VRATSLANEPRIAAFAEKREAQLRDIYDELLREQPKVEVNRLECFASSCVSELELSIESRDDLNRFLGQLALKPYYSAQFPRVRMNDSAGKAYVSFALLFSAEQRDHEKYEETVSLFMGAE